MKSNPVPAELRMLQLLVVASWHIVTASSDCLTAPAVSKVLSISAPVVAAVGGGSYALYTCQVGYEFWSADANAYNRTCTAASGWEPLTDCQPVHCPALPTDANTLLSTTESTYGTTVEVSCQSAYQVVGLPPGQSLPLICQANKAWNSTVGATLCVNVRCTHPAIANATWDGGAAYAAVLTTTNYTCQPGFFFPGNETSHIFTCSNVGSWLPSGFVCEPVHCPTLTIPNGFIDLPNATAYGSAVVASCETGYQFSDGAVTPTLVCRSDRTWTPLTSYCKPLVCPTPPSPAHTAHDVNGSVTYGSVLNYTCDDDYLFADGASWRLSECGPQSLWTPVIPACLPAGALPQPGVKYVEQQVEAPDAESISSLPLGIAGTLLAIMFLLDVITFPIQLAYVKKNLKAFADRLKRPEPEPEPEQPVFNFPSVISLGRGRVTAAPSVADLGFLRDEKGDIDGNTSPDGDKAQLMNFPADEVKRKASTADISSDSLLPAAPPAPAAVHSRAQPLKPTGPIDVATKKERLKSAKRSVQQAIELAVLANNLSRGGGGGGAQVGGGGSGGHRVARSSAFVPNILPLHGDNIGATRGSISVAIEGFENEVENSEDSDDDDDDSDEDEDEEEEHPSNGRSSIPGQVAAA